MKGFYLIDRIKEIIKDHAPKKDKRMSIGPLDLIYCLIFNFIGDAKVFSLESLRRALIAESGSSISRSAAWERLASKSLTGILCAIFSQVMQQISSRCGVNSGLEKLLGVSGISIFDSSIVTLLSGAKDFFDGTFKEAGIKFHFELNNSDGSVRWGLLSAASVHDSCGFPDIETLSGRLSLFDLGYFDWNRFKKMNDLGAFFLSRLKSNSSIKISKVINGLKDSHVGKLLGELSFKRSRGDIVEFITERKIDKTIVEFRVIGFWNPEQKRYHWYITNLQCSAKLIAPLYKLRWQIELLIKAAKQSLNLDQIPSANERIILNLSIARLIAIGISQTIRKIAFLNLLEAKQEAISLQRAAKVFAQLASDFINFIKNDLDFFRSTLRRKLKSLMPELFDPNYKKRKTSLGVLNQLAEQLG